MASDIDAASDVQSSFLRRKDKKFYQDTGVKNLTSAEREVFIQATRKPTQVYLDETDLKYAQSNKLNYSRIIFFLFKDFLARKKPTWGDLDDGSDTNCPAQ